MKNMKRNFVHNILTIALGWMVSYTDNTTDFFGGIFVTSFLVEIFNFIRYANNTTTDVILYNECLRLLISQHMII